MWGTYTYAFLCKYIFFKPRYFSRMVEPSLLKRNINIWLHCFMYQHWYRLTSVLYKDISQVKPWDQNRIHNCFVLSDTISFAIVSSCTDALLFTCLAQNLACTAACIKGERLNEVLCRLYKFYEQWCIRDIE